MKSVMIKQSHLFYIHISCCSYFVFIKLKIIPYRVQFEIVLDYLKIKFLFKDELASSVTNEMFDFIAI